MKRILILSVLFATLVACSATTKHKVLTVFFDGVPERAAERTPPPEPAAAAAPAPEPAAAEPDPVLELAAADIAAGGYAAIDELPLRPVPLRTTGEWRASEAALEKAATWEEALRLLPLDIAGGVDWVAAVDQGLAVPQLVLEADAMAPFTLDTLTAAAAARPDSPFLDFTVEMTPEDNPFFSVTFPHSSHTLFLACSSCHPGVQEWDVEMDEILAGKACGQCHGRVSFDPETSCARCHQNLEPPDEEAVDAELEAARQQAVPASAELLERGAGLYARYCALCHGEDGAGAGRLAPWLDTKPRNFTSGTYKFRSSLGPLPTDLDLYRTITRGVPGTSMPAWSALASEDRWAMVHYVKKFSSWFEEEEPEEPITITAAPALTEALLAQGRELYTGSGCNACHGDQGRGDGPSAPSLKDSWGEPIRPFNFASGRPLKSGSRLEDIFKVVMTGIGGTPMPVFGQSLSPQQAWAVARYVDTFRGQQRAPFNVRGDIYFERNGFASGAGAPPTAVAEAPDAGGGFWGYEDDAAAAEQDAGGFWGYEGDEEGGAEPAAEQDAGGFWGYEDDAEGAAEPAAEGADSFWGVEEEAGEDAAAGDDFWGGEEEAGEDTGAGDDFWGVEDGGDGAAAGDDDDWFGRAEEAGDAVAQPDVPPATFPHWFHRIRFKCTNCHPKVFQMKAGANPMNMDAMRAGLYCAKCHNGEIAWEIGFTNCPKCHQARAADD